MAPEKYRQIAKHLDLPCSTNEEGIESLINAIKI